MTALVAIISALLILVVTYVVACELHVRDCLRRGICPVCDGTGTDMTPEQLYYSRGISCQCLSCDGTGKATKYE